VKHIWDLVQSLGFTRYQFLYAIQSKFVYSCNFLRIFLSNTFPLSLLKSYLLDLTRCLWWLSVAFLKTSYNYWHHTRLFNCNWSIKNWSSLVFVIQFWCKWGSSCSRICIFNALSHKYRVLLVRWCEFWWRLLSCVTFDSLNVASPKTWWQLWFTKSRVSVMNVTSLWNLEFFLLWQVESVIILWSDLLYSVPKFCCL
jgi:hypothetical protein